MCKNIPVLDGKGIEYVLKGIVSRFEKCVVLPVLESYDDYPLHEWKKSLNDGYTTIIALKVDEYTDLIVSWAEGDKVHIELYEPIAKYPTLYRMITKLFGDVIYDSIVGTYFSKPDYQLLPYNCIFWLLHRLKYGAAHQAAPKKFTLFCQCLDTPVKGTLHRTPKGTPKVVSLKGRKPQIVDPSTELYIGRNIYMGGWKLPKSKWANPFKVTAELPIDKVLKDYKEYVVNSELINDIGELAGKTLCCWCKPKPCHGDVLIELFKERN